MIQDELEIPVDDSIFWTDSTCVIRYIENEEKRFTTFVANRVAAIREQSLPKQWHYVETALNPADDASRGMAVNAIINKNRWIRGPDFLWHDEMSWPKRPADMDRTAKERCSLEEKKAVVAGLVTPIDGGSNNLLDRFSSWFHLKKCVAWVLRYKSRLQCAANKPKRGETMVVAPAGKIEPLDVSEIEDAERAIIKATQSARFQDELTSLSSLQKVVKKSSGIFKLDPILVDGIIRVGGRLHNSEIEPDAKHSVLLPKDHHVSHLIIRHYHRVSGHSGIEHTLSLIRQKYWITQARASVRRLLSSCFDCRRRQAPLGHRKWQAYRQTE
ncbi:PREDICTED: uncharacterized protein LOC107358056 [Acropora digitifera]|uniref:uncharacterized protein LOC107358056 n=1 Tax=Acropora digitifera TaxID=70779 RepID=UPI000779FFC9|nr:PREDICTED: uncharacterized protein LOC107358056 [Acropora digitifera]